MSKTKVRDSRGKKNSSGTHYVVPVKGGWGVAEDTSIQKRSQPTARALAFYLNSAAVPSESELLGSSDKEDTERTFKVDLRKKASDVLVRSLFRRFVAHHSKQFKVEPHSAALIQAAIKKVPSLLKTLEEAVSEIISEFGDNASMVLKTDADFWALGCDPELTLVINTREHVPNLYTRVKPLSIKYGQKTFESGVMLFISPGSTTE